MDKEQYEEFIEQHDTLNEEIKRIHELLISETSLNESSFYEVVFCTYDRVYYRHKFNSHESFPAEWLWMDLDDVKSAIQLVIEQDKKIEGIKIRLRKDELEEYRRLSDKFGEEE